MAIVPKDDLRLFSGVVQMRHDEPGLIHFHHEYWVGWYRNKKEAKGDWSEQTMAKPEYSGMAMSNLAAHDITDQAALGFIESDTHDQ